MPSYSRPATRRTYEAIHADLVEATAALAANKVTGVEFWQVQAEGCERLVNLWNEIVFQAVDDTELPHWTRFAAMTTRDHYASQVREARAEASRRAFRQDKLLSSLSTSISCAGRVALVAATVSGIAVRYWACEAHAAEDGRASADVYAAWKSGDEADPVPAGGAKP